MSVAAAHESTDVRRACQACHDRKARTLCFKCYRAERQASRAPRLTDKSAARPLYLPGDFRGRPLTDREIAHRQQMLAHLASGVSSL
jgi:hypothetical protein